MNRVLEEIGLLGIVPVIAIENAEDAEPLGRALMDGGLPCAEVTFRTAAAAGAMTRLAKALPEMLMGAGTVLSIEQVKIAVDCGAQFIVSPGLNRTVVEYCLRNQIPVTPGVATPTEVEAALELGIEVVKFFPAEAGGGVEFLKAISAPYGKVRFIPTGGIDESNLLSYLMLPKVLACGGSWMVKADLVSGGRFDEIRKLTERAVGRVLGFELRHVGISHADAGEARAGARRLAELLKQPLRDGDSSTFVGKGFEFLTMATPGEKGHIAIGTNSVGRAISYFARQNVGTRAGTLVEKDGNPASVYLDIEICGFSVHLVQV